MIDIYLWNGINKNTDRYKNVLNETKQKQSLVIKAVLYKDKIYNCYGCHRLYAAQELNIVPVLILLPYDEKYGDMSLYEFSKKVNDNDPYLRDENCKFPICCPLKKIFISRNQPIITFPKIIIS